MVNMYNLMRLLEKQPLQKQFIRDMAFAEKEFLESKTMKNTPNEILLKRFHNILLQHGVVKSMSIETTWLEDLETIKKACS